MHRPRWGVALLSVTLIAAAAAVATGGAAAAAAATSFRSSFETDDPQPTWTDTVDAAAGSGGVDGNVVVGMPGSLRGHVTGIAVNAEPNSNEGRNNLNDGDSATKWLVDTPTSWAQ